MVGPRRVNNRRLYRRMFDIWGVSKKEIKPPIKREGIWIFTPGQYDRDKHELSVDPAFKTLFRSTLRHELRHGMQRVILPKNMKLDFESTRYFIESTNSTERGPWHEYLRSSGGTAETDPALAWATSLIGIPVAVGLVIREYRRHKYFQRFFSTHGEDGLLLLWAHPPVNQRREATTRFQLWESRMIKKGFLKEQGGLTQQGLAYLRRKINREKIIARINEMKKVREKK